MSTYIFAEECSMAESLRKSDDDVRIVPGCLDTANSGRDALVRALMDSPTPPIRTSSEPTGAPPSAPVQNRKPGRPFGRSTSSDTAIPPIRTSSEPAPELLALLPSPSPADLKATRLAAGHTQSQAAAAIGMRRWATWSDYEGGIRRIPPLAWTWYLLATGAHPTAMLRKAPKTKR